MRKFRDPANHRLSLRLSFQLLLTFTRPSLTLSSTRFSSGIAGCPFPSVSPEIEGYCLAAYILFLLNFIREQPRLSGTPPQGMNKKCLHLSPLAAALREDAALWRVFTYAHRFGDCRDGVHREEEP